MWDANFNVILKNNMIISFKLWHNFLSDDLDWKPPLEWVYKYSRARHVIWNQEYFSITSHVVYHNNHIYLSTKSYYNPFCDEKTTKAYNEIKNNIDSSDTDNIYMIV